MCWMQWTQMIYDLHLNFLSNTQSSIYGWWTKGLWGFYLMKFFILGICIFRGDLKQFLPFFVCHFCTWYLTHWTASLMFFRNKNECLQYIGAYSKGSTWSAQDSAGGLGDKISIH